MKDGRKFSRIEARDYEKNLSLNCLDSGEFVEGVRALLIDKDFRPNWRKALSTSP